jgi:hypothetical protein
VRRYPVQVRGRAGHAFAPTEHIWVAEKMHWMKLDDGLPQYPEAVPL